MVYDFNPAQSEILLAALNEKLRVESENLEKSNNFAHNLIETLDKYPYQAGVYFYEMTATNYEKTVGDIEAIVEIGSKFAQREQLSGTGATNLFTSASTNALLRLKRYRDLLSILKNKADSKKTLDFDS